MGGLCSAKAGRKKAIPRDAWHSWETRSAACPHGYKVGASPLAGQYAAYIERQLAAFAQGLRQNDINEQMRTIAIQLTPAEMHALAAFYGAPESARVANK